MDTEPIIHSNNDTGKIADRIAGGILGAIVLVSAGVAFFRTKRKLVTVSESSEDWEDALGI